MTSKSAVAFFLLTAVAALPPSATAFTVVPSVGCSHQTWGAVRPVSHSSLFMSSTAVEVSSAEAVATYQKNVEKMLAKDKTSKALGKDDIKVVHEDEHIVVVEKPSGVLCVPDKAGNPSLAASVFEAFGCESGNPDKMVAQRLGFDTSGLIVFAKTDAAIAGLNTALRTRKMVRKYEALLCGEVSGDESGEITFPLTRDVASLPYMRVYTEESQKALLAAAKDLPEDVRKSLVRNELPSVTKYDVVGKEELGGQPVTRVTLTSVSGRTHQLNAHCAAFGHPIAGDATYGVGGDASPNGGFTDEEMDSHAPNRASAELQTSIASAASGLCVHLKELGFRHPVTGEALSFESKTPF